MLSELNHQVRTIDIPGIRKFANKVVKYDDGINLTIGEPDFPTPENVKSAGIEAIKKNLTTYSHNAGLQQLRQAVAQYFQDKYHFTYHPETEIIITHGATQGIDSILRTILNQGDEVILPAPIYSGYEPMIHYLEAKPVYIDTTQTNFIPTVSQIEQVITERTKAIIFNYPANPTGAVLDRPLMDELIDCLKTKNIFIISDEIYSENVFEQEHISFASYDDIRDQLFLVQGLSKSHAMTGWRIGFVLGPQYLMQELIKLHLNNIICATMPSQYAAIEALKNSRETPTTMNKSYIKRRDYMYEQLKDIGFQLVKPQGAFYLFPSIKSMKMSSIEFAEQLLRREHVAVVPGSAFTKYGEGYIRISYATSFEQLKMAIKRLRKFVSDQSQRLGK